MKVISRDLPAVETTRNNNLMNATELGELLGIPTTRMNLILAELGWIVRDGKDWRITEPGKALGAVQRQHDRSKKFYVHWPRTILENRSLCEAVRESRGEAATRDGAGQNNTVDKPHFRQKFPGTHWTMDGHYVKSKAEAIIDNWLYHYKIPHAYEKRLPIDEDVYCDFFINAQTGVYVEYWGSQTDLRYLAHKNWKIQVYERYGFQLIQLTDKELATLDDVLPKTLRAFGITTE